MSYLHVTFSVYVAAVQMTCSFVVLHGVCMKDCFTRPQNCHQGAVFKAIHIISEEAAVCISHGTAVKSFGLLYG